MAQLPLRLYERPPWLTPAGFAHTPLVFRFLPSGGVHYCGMDFYDLTRSFQTLWENKPGAVVLLGLGFIVFLFLVVDAWRHKRRKRRTRPHPHH